MERTVKTNRNHNRYHHPEPDEYDSQDLLAAGIGGSSHRDGKSSEQKASSNRSKHSETEQRRRCKINERFQILKDLIPPNDQKRDKASLLLEVIEYIQFLQEKLQMYEGSYPGCGQEPAKLIPRRGSHVPVEGFADHSQVMRSDCESENNVAQPVGNEKQSAEPNFTGVTIYRGNEHLSRTDTSGAPFSMPLKPRTYPLGTGILPSENLSYQPLLESFLSGPSMMEHPIAGSSSGETELDDNSTTSCQRLLKNLTRAFQSSGVDLSQTSISVQLDISKKAKVSVAAATSAAMEDIRGVSVRDQYMIHSEARANDDSIPSTKRPRIRESTISINHP